MVIWKFSRKLLPGQRQKKLIGQQRLYSILIHNSHFTQLSGIRAGQKFLILLNKIKNRFYFKFFAAFWQILRLYREGYHHP